MAYSIKRNSFEKERKINDAILLKIISLLKKKKHLTEVYFAFPSDAMEKK
jgi:hypothetical protein